MTDNESEQAMNRLHLAAKESLITGAQPKAGTGLKMQTVSVVFSTLHC